MKIVNNTSYVLSAIGWHTKRGHGEYVEIESGESANISGPCLGEMDSGKCYIHLHDEVVYQETPDDNNGFQVLKEKPLNMESDNNGVTISYSSKN